MTPRGTKSSKTGKATKKSAKTKKSVPVQHMDDTPPAEKDLDEQGLEDGSVTVSESTDESEQGTENEQTEQGNGEAPKEEPADKGTRYSVHLDPEERELVQKHSVYREPMTAAVRRLAMERCQQLEAMALQMAGQPQLGTSAYTTFPQVASQVSKPGEEE